MPVKNTMFDGSETSMGDQVSETASQVKDKVMDAGRTAVDKIDSNRETAARGLDTAADVLHDKAGSLPGGETIANLAHSTADKLSSTADYVRGHDVKKMMADLEQMVKNNPGPSLLAAAVIGFLAGRAFRRDD